MKQLKLGIKPRIDEAKPIAKRFFRVWLGPKQIPKQFEIWWQRFKDMHPSYDFVTIRDNHDIDLPPEIVPIYNKAHSYAGRSDILRILAPLQHGGVYIDTDMMPLKPFDSLIEDDPRLFIGLRSGKSFNSAVFGARQGDPALQACIEALPSWYERHESRACSVSTGPAFVSSVLFGREDVRHLPIKTFYPYPEWGSPSKEDKNEMFSDSNNFPPEMFAAHYSTNSWGGNPNKKNRTKK